MGSINLLEWVAELRKPIYSQDHWFVLKDISGTAEWKRHTGERMQEGARASLLSEHTTLPNLHCVHKPGSSLNPVPLDFYGGFISQT